MSTVMTSVKRIALITNDIANVELINDAREYISERASLFPAAAGFADMLVTPYSSTDKAHSKLFAETQALATLGLIVLDGMVRKESAGGAPGDGLAAMALLDWLTANLPAVPVIVLISERVEGLDLRLVKRRNIVPLNLAEGDFNAAFAKALELAVNSAKPSRRRLTVEVGDFIARYYTMEGSDVRETGTYEYKNLPDLHHLLDRINGYSPMSNGRASDDWQADFREFGDEVFNTFIDGTIGPHIMGHFQDDGVNRSPVDLRFEIDVGKDEKAQLFGLPFELAKPPENYDNFLCTCVPMARRIHFIQGPEEKKPHPPNLPPKRHERPLRVLFINASFKGSAVVEHEWRTGESVPIPGLNELTNTAAELEAVKEFSSKKWKNALERVTVVGGKPNQTADKLLDQMRELVESQKFDILHFAGHSVTLEDDGGTFLIFPDKSGVGQGVSMRVVANWVSAANIRMVLLSSCSGSSLRTAIEVMRKGAEAVLGFRWDVNDRACVEYFRHFYRLYLTRNKSIAEAYCGACHEVQSSMHGLPIWASAIAVVKD